MDNEMHHHIQSVKRVQATKDAMKELIASTNVMGCDEDFAQGIFEALLGEHRTLQQSTVRAIAEALALYSEIDTDLRNEEAVNFAKKVKAMEHFFPMV